MNSNTFGIDVNFALGAAWLLVSLGCASANPDPSSSGGAPATGGTSQGGGTATGGTTSQGGATSGGSSTTGGASQSGGASSSGGATTSGGATASGGTGTGGTTASGGTGTGGGATVTGGATASGGAMASGGAKASGGAASGGAPATGGATATGGSGGASSLAKFSFFVVSYPTMAKLSGKAEGFGGDLKFGKADGLSGADEICRQASELGLPGAGQKKWRAFLSATTGGASGGAVNARDRIGTGPWYDVRGRLVANDLAGLFSGARPAGETLVVNDLPNEFGNPNHYTGPSGLQATTVDNHDTLTGSDTMGNLRATSAADTCNDWTSTTATGKPYIGHSWPRSATNGTQWASDHTVPGCAAGIDRTLGGSGSGSCVGCSGGYGGFYCFAVP